MSPLAWMIDPAFSVRLTTALLHFLWQGCCGGGLVIVGAALLKHASASWRYSFNVATLLLLAACLPVTFCLVQAPDPVLKLISTQIPAQEPSRADANSSPLDSLPTAEVPLVSTEFERPLTSGPSITKSEFDAGSFETVVATSRPDFQAGYVSLSRPVSGLETIAPWVSSFYLTCVALILVRLLQGVWGGHRLRQVARSIDDQTLLDMVGQQARRLGLKIVPAIAWCEQISIPVVVGIIKPMILLPVAVVSGLTSNQLQALLLHELAHIRRFDPVVNLLQRIVEALLFFHPVVWFVSRRISIEREHAADDIVLAAGWDRPIYADALVRMAELSSSIVSPRIANQAALIGATGTSPSEFKRRVLRLLDDTKPQKFRLTRGGFLATVVVVASLLGTMVFVQAKSNVEGDSVAESTPLQPKPLRYTADLPGGLQVEFVGLAEMGNDVKTWWKPDGTVLEPAPTDKFKGTTSLGGLEVRRALIRVHGVKSYLDVKSNMSGFRDDESHDSGGPYVRYVGALGVNPGQKTASVEVGIATQPLSPLRKLDPSGKRLPPDAAAPFDSVLEDIRIVQIGHPRLRSVEDRIVNGKPVPLTPEEELENAKRRTQTELTFLPSLPLKHFDFHLTLIDIDGQSHFSQSQSFSMEKPEVAYTFDVPQTRVARFEYRLRTYQHWVTFQNVSLKPGYETDVNVLIATMPKGQVPNHGIGQHHDVVQSSHDSQSLAATASIGTSGDKERVDAPPAPDQPQAETIVGTVVSFDNKPVPGIEVLAFQSAIQYPEKFVSDENGQFRVPKAWRTTEHYLTLVARDGRERLGWFDFFFHAYSDNGQKSDDGSFRLKLLPMNRIVRGRLVDQSGQAITKIPLRVEYLQHEINFASAHWKYQTIHDEPIIAGCVTDDDGQYEFKLPANSHAWLGAEHPDWVVPRIQVPSDKDDVRITVLKPAAKVAGRVVDGRTGKPLAGVFISAQALNQTMQTGLYGEAKSDADGRYVIGGLASDQFSIQLSKVIFKTLTAPILQPVELKSGETFSADFTLQVGKRLSGRVLEKETDQPAARSKVSYSGTGANLTVETNDKGEFEFIVPPGKCEVDAGESRLIVAEQSREIDVPTDRDPEPIVLKVGVKTEDGPFGLKIFVGPPLDRKASCHYVNARLVQALEGLCSATAVKLDLDVDGLKSEGYTINLPVSLDADRITLKEALTRILQPYEKLSFMLDEKQNHVFVSTRKKVEFRERALAQAEAAALPGTPDEAKKAWGVAQHGLRARVVPVLSSMSEDAIDPSQRVSKFAKVEDVAFVVELENVSDKPIKLLDTRYGEGFGKSAGKANSDWNGQFLFAIDLFDRDGKKIERPEVQIVDLDMILSGVQVTNLDVDQTHRFLLRPAKWQSVLAPRIEPGQYRVAISYLGLPNRVATRIKEYRPTSTVLGAVEGDVVSLQVPFEVMPSAIPDNSQTEGADPQPAAIKPARIWGEPANGLRAAVEFFPQQAAYMHGQKPEIRLVVQNVSDKSITLSSHLWLSDLETTIKNDQGQAVAVASTWYSGWTLTSRVTLQPQQIVVYNAGNVGLAISEELAKKFEHVTHRTLVAPNGKYTLQLDGHFGGAAQLKDGKGRILAPLEGDWNGELKTGAAPFTIINESPEPEPKKAAATAPPKGLEFLTPYPKLHGLSLDMTEQQFLDIAKRQKLTPRKTGDGGKTQYGIPTGDDHTVIVMFTDNGGKCSGIQRIRGVEREPIDVLLKLDRQEFLLGESIAVDYQMTNNGTKAAPYGKGGFYPDLRINDGFRMSAVKVDENGKPIAEPINTWPTPENHGGPVGGFKLMPGEKYSAPLFVTRYLRFVEPGRYRLRVQNIDRLEPNASVYSTGETYFVLKQSTLEEARGVFERMKKAPRKAYDDNEMKYLSDAADFQAMHQSVYLPVLKEYAARSDRDALESLERMGSIEANEVLVAVMSSALDRNDWQTARTCYQHLKECLPFPNWYNEPLNDYDKPKRDRVARTWRADFVPMLIRLAKRLNVEVTSLMQERETKPADTDAKDPEFVKISRRGYFPSNHPQSLLVDIDFIYRCVGRPEDLADCLMAYAHSIELTKTLPLETMQYFRPRGSASGFGHTVMYLLRRGGKPPIKITHPGEAAAFVIALRQMDSFRPVGWQAELMKWLKQDSPYLSEIILDHLPEPVPNEVLDELPKLLANTYVDLQIAACHVARKHPRTMYRAPLQKILDTATDQYLRKYAVDAARANGIQAKYDPDAPFVDQSKENVTPEPDKNQKDAKTPDPAKKNSTGEAPSPKAPIQDAAVDVSGSNEMVQFSGTVVGHDKKSITGATVALSVSTNKDFLPVEATITTVVTDAAGAFRLSARSSQLLRDDPTSKIVLWAWTADVGRDGVGFASANQSDISQPYTIFLQEPDRDDVELVDSDGQPLPGRIEHIGVSKDLLLPDDLFKLVLERREIQGGFRLSGLPKPISNRAVLIEVTGRGSRLFTWRKSRLPAETPIRLIARAPSIIRGRLIATKQGTLPEALLKQAEIVLVSLDSDPARNLSGTFGRAIAKCDAEGRFEIRNLGSGKLFQLQVRTGNVSGWKSLTPLGADRTAMVFPPGVETKLEIPLTPTRVVQGQLVTETGAPLPNTEVIVEHGNLNREMRRGEVFRSSCDHRDVVRTDALGKFSVEVVPGTVAISKGDLMGSRLTYTLRWPLDLVIRRPGNILQIDGGDVPLILPPVRVTILTGRLVNHENKPIKGLILATLGSDSERIGRAESKIDGSFRLETLVAPEAFEVIEVDPSYQLSSTQFPPRVFRTETIVASRDPLVLQVKRITNGTGTITQISGNAFRLENDSVISTDDQTKYVRLTDNREEPAARNEPRAGVRVQYELLTGQHAAKVIILADPPNRNVDKKPISEKPKPGSADVKTDNREGN